MTSTNSKTILVIDDERDILKSLKDLLEAEDFRVITAATGDDGLEAARKFTPDLILLDLRLPDTDGFQVCRLLKATTHLAAIPVLMLTTRATEVDKVVGLEIGADDYITKPYSPMELVMRVRVALRRQAEPPPTLTFKELTLNPDAFTVTIRNKPVRLTRKEFDLLMLFLSKPGKAFARSTLLSKIWGENSDSLSGTLDSHIKTLRQKIRPADRYLVTINGVGYRWGDASDAE